MSFDLERAGEDQVLWKRLALKYKKKLLAEGWEGPIEPEQLQNDANYDLLHNVLMEAVCEEGREEEFVESDGDGIPGSADFASITKLLGKFFVTGSYLNGGPYDTYQEAAKEAGLGD